MITGRMVVNLDSEEDSDICVSSAGGAVLSLRVPIRRSAGVVSQYSVKIPSEAMREATGKTPGVVAVHAGLEYGSSMKTILTPVIATVGNECRRPGQSHQKPYFKNDFK